MRVTSENAYRIYHNRENVISCELAQPALCPLDDRALYKHHCNRKQNQANVIECITSLDVPIILASGQATALSTERQHDQDITEGENEKTS